MHVFGLVIYSTKRAADMCEGKKVKSGNNRYSSPAACHPLCVYAAPITLAPTMTR
jgi:hypothetical protein